MVALQSLVQWEGAAGLARGGVATGRWTFNSYQANCRIVQATYRSVDLAQASASMGKAHRHAWFSLNRFDQAAYNLSETGQSNIRALRGWAKSKGWVRGSYPPGTPERWGTYMNGKFEWRLNIKPEPTFTSGIHPGSGFPRFDARTSIGTGKEGFINPFTGEIGNSQHHLPLEASYW